MILISYSETSKLKLATHPWKKSQGTCGLVLRNDRGDRLIKFCFEPEYSITNTYFKLLKRIPRRSIDVLKLKNDT